MVEIMGDIIQDVTVASLYKDLSHTLAGPLLKECTYPWDALPRIGGYIQELIYALNKSEYTEILEDVYVHNTATVYPTVQFAGPCIIGPETEVRQAAFIRGNALVGANCVVGNSTELKNVILFENVQVPHYNYVGDSILGYKSHMGAGSITSNVKSDKTLVHVKSRQPEKSFDIATGLKKFGAMLGDRVEVGCNSVLNPGTVIGHDTNIYPLSPVRGYIPPESIYKTGGVIVAKN